MFIIISGGGYKLKNKLSPDEVNKICQDCSFALLNYGKAKCHSPIKKYDYGKVKKELAITGRCPAKVTHEQLKQKMGG